MSDKMSKEDLIKRIQQSPSGKVWNEDEIKQLLMTNQKQYIVGFLQYISYRRKKRRRVERLKYKTVWVLMQTIV